MSGADPSAFGFNHSVKVVIVLLLLDIRSTGCPHDPLAQFFRAVGVHGAGLSVHFSFRLWHFLFEFFQVKIIFPCTKRYSLFQFFPCLGILTFSVKRVRPAKPGIGIFGVESCTFDEILICESEIACLFIEIVFRNAFSLV